MVAEVPEPPDYAGFLVTGANKGIGYAVCQGLGALGWRVGWLTPRS